MQRTAWVLTRQAERFSLFAHMWRAAYCVNDSDARLRGRLVAKYRYPGRLLSGLYIEDSFEAGLMPCYTARHPSVIPVCSDEPAEARRDEFH